MEAWGSPCPGRRWKPRSVCRAARPGSQRSPRPLPAGDAGARGAGPTVGTVARPAAFRERKTSPAGRSHLGLSLKTGSHGSHRHEDDVMQPDTTRLPASDWRGSSVGRVVVQRLLELFGDGVMDL